MDEALQPQVFLSGGGIFEYCRLPQRLTRLPFQIDHIIAEKHEGPTRPGEPLRRVPAL